MDPFYYSTIPLFFPGIFTDGNDRDKYLDSLDSDTRDYVLHHTDAFSSRQELEDCVRALKGNDAIK
ncbi:MAG: hypothetical protein ACLRZ7_03460 [Lachnospiraceae bacterium]